MLKYFMVSPFFSSQMNSNFLYPEGIKNISQLFVILSFVVLASGCATVSVPVESGFLKDYSNMKLSTVFEGVYVDKHATLGLEQYSSFIIEPVVFQFHKRLSQTVERYDENGFPVLFPEYWEGLLVHQLRVAVQG